MRVTLTQDELFQAISEHLRDKLNLDNTASIEISFTAGRGPKGYTADVEITYPKSELASKITAKAHDDEVVSAAQAQTAVAATTITDPNTTAVGATSAGIDPSAAVPKDNLFQ